MNTSEKLKHKLQRLSNKYLVVRSAVGLSFIFLAFVTFTKINFPTDIGKLLMVIFGLVVIALSVMLVAEYIMKVLWLQTEPKVKRYSAIVSLNGFLGLVLPLIFFNIVLGSVVRYFGMMSNYETIFCKMRYAFIDFYRMNHVYGQLNNLVFGIILMLLALFLFGGLFEKVNKK